MDRFNSFLRTTLIGGIAVVLPVAILAIAFRWIFAKISNAIQPMTNFFMKSFGLMEDEEQLVKIVEGAVDVLVILLIVFACFLIGLLVKTRMGRYAHETLERRVLRAFPGYSLVKETVLQFIGAKRSPFSTVALVQLFDSNTLCSAFVTDEHPDGSYTVFVPTGPNPTSGQIFHLEAKRVHIIDVPVEETMRAILSCGAGSTKLVEAYRQKLEWAGEPTAGAPASPADEAPPIGRAPAEGSAGETC